MIEHVVLGTGSSYIYDYILLRYCIALASTSNNQVLPLKKFLWQLASSCIFHGDVSKLTNFKYWQCPSTHQPFPYLAHQILRVSQKIHTLEL